MSQISDYVYTPKKALKGIGKKFWAKYKDDLLAFAIDQTRTDIPESIHADWDGLFHWRTGTDRRIEWALALYEHGDWPGLKKNDQNDAAKADDRETPPPPTPIEPAAVSPRKPVEPIPGHNKPVSTSASSTSGQNAHNKTKLATEPPASSSAPKSKPTAPKTQASKAKARKKKPTPKSASTSSAKKAATVKRKCSNCRFSKNPDQYCPHGMFGPCDEWVEATPVEEHWPTWEDMKRAEREDYRSRYREY